MHNKFGNNKLNDDSINISLNGSAGQSLGAFLAKGIKITVFGDSNDYVGKGLSGGKIIVRPSRVNKLKSNENVIIGNTVLYGATGGMLFASGKAGERFAVRNSGGKAVVEGCGSNGCEYMTGGVTVILGKVGDNFGAGMTGGMSFVYDPNNEFENYANPQTIVWQKPETEYWKKELQSLMTQFVSETDSKIAKDILDDFEDEVLKFKQICPKEMLDKLENPISFKDLKSKTA